MLDQAFYRLKDVELRLERVLNRTVVTVPIYNPAILPQDTMDGQIAIGTDDSIGWLYNGIWTWEPALVPTVTDFPQDAVEGQVAVGNDTNLYWYSSGTWHTGTSAAASGNPPQDSVDGQLVVGTNSIFWCIGGIWYGFGGTNDTLFGGHTNKTITGAAGSINDDNTGELFTPDDFGNGIFYVWSAPANATVTFTTSAGIGVDIADTIIQVYDSAPDANVPNWIAGNDDYDSTTYSQISFSAIAGTVYYILVQGFSSSNIGSFILSWS